MEVRAGYKQTEVGVIPADWIVKSIRDLAQIKTGPFGTLLKASEYSRNEGVPLISVGEVGVGTFKVTERTPLVPSVVARRLPQYLLRSGDIVFGRKGAVERSALVTEAENGWFLGSDGISIRPQDTCYPPYLAHQFQRHEVQAWLLQNATGTTMASLNQAILGCVQFPYAPLTEQRAIANSLSDVDALLTGLDRLIAKKRDLKQAAMQQLLTGQTRLPGFEGEWEVKRLGDLLTICHGKSQREVEVDDGAYPILATGGRIGTAKRALYDKPSVLIGRKGTINQPQYMNTPFWTVDTLFYSAIKDDNSARFLYYRFCLIDWMQYNEASGVPSLNARTIENIEVDFPEPVEQKAIAAVLSDMDAELTALEARREKTRLLKLGMMQELLTGKTRLISPEPAHA
jgi:type I restriction enzyme S subunit